MRKGLKVLYFVVYFIYYILFLGCVQESNDELSVFAAISLKEALSEIGSVYTERHNVKINYNFGASTTLQRQIEKGASADIYIPASSHQMDALQKQTLIYPSSRKDILTNELVVVTHQENGFSLEELKNLADPIIDKIAIGQPGIVPAGTYTKEVLVQQNLWNKIQSKLIFGNNVRSTLAFVSTRNVDLGIVYQTDVVISDNIKIVLDIPPKTHSQIRYPVALIKGTTKKQLAELFILYLRSDDVTDIFTRYGFTNLTSE
ncbi:molybdate ABC transporter substrate-binding protein [Candidatus Poribacteria bacterium]|nr:molybdate ABC transporter substrate-binding protein [Candidatus Poribacteria bacterium]